MQSASCDPQLGPVQSPVHQEPRVVREDLALPSSQSLEPPYPESPLRLRLRYRMLRVLHGRSSDLSFLRASTHIVFDSYLIATSLNTASSSDASLFGLFEDDTFLIACLFVDGRS